MESMWCYKWWDEDYDIFVKNAYGGTISSEQNCKKGLVDRDIIFRSRITRQEDACEEYYGFNCMHDIEEEYDSDDEHWDEQMGGIENYKEELDIRGDYQHEYYDESRDPETLRDAANEPNGFIDGWYEVNQYDQKQKAKKKAKRGLLEPWSKKKDDSFDELAEGDIETKYCRYCEDRYKKRCWNDHINDKICDCEIFKNHNCTHKFKCDVCETQYLAEDVDSSVIKTRGRVGIIAFPIVGLSQGSAQLIGTVDLVIRSDRIGSRKFRKFRIGSIFF